MNNEMTKEERVAITQSKKYKTLLIYNWFQKGDDKIGFIKWLIVFFGVASQDVLTTISFGIIYLPSCLLFGFLYYRCGWLLAENEIGNQFNLLAKELRKRLKT